MAAACRTIPSLHRILLKIKLCKQSAWNFFCYVHTKPVLFTASLESNLPVHERSLPILGRSLPVSGKAVPQMHF